MAIKQGCVLTLLLFNLFFTEVLLYVFRDLDLGKYIRYHVDGLLLDLQHLTAKTNTLERHITKMLFVDDCALIAHQKKHLQAVVNRFAEASKVFWPDNQPQEDKSPHPAYSKQCPPTAMQHHQ